MYFFFSSSNYPHSFTFMHPTFQSFVGLCLLRLFFDICVDVCFYTTCELYSHQLYHLLPFYPQNLRTTYEHNYRTTTLCMCCVCILRILLYFCCSPYVIMCPVCCCLCQRSTDFTPFCCYQHYRQPKLDNIFWSQKSTEHRRDNTYEKLLNFFFSYINKHNIQTVI